MTKKDFTAYALSLSKKLRAPSASTVAWVKSKVFTNVAYRDGNEVWCSSCGGVFRAECSPLSTSLEVDISKCPCCGMAVSIKHSKRKKVAEKFYISILSVLSGVQVLRYFLAERYSRRGCATTSYLREAVQVWVSEDFKEVILARSRKPSSIYFDVWNFSTPLSPKRQLDIYRDPYTIFCDTAPRAKIAPWLKKRGFTLRAGITPITLIRVLSDNSAEMLLKIGDYHALRFFFGGGHPYPFSLFRAQYLIARRHGYKISDLQLWVDHIDIVRALGLDDRNPSFICPKDIKGEHAKLVARLQRMREREKAKKSAEALMRREEEYALRVGHLLPLTIGTDGGLSASLLRSVKEFEEEGAAMRHCVFECRYDEKDTSLVFSVVSNGKRVATVELGNSGEVLQCRGVANSIPAREADILSLFESNKLKILEKWQTLH